MSFKLIETKIKGLKLFELDIFKDERGFFIETYKKSDFEKIGITEEFVQDNHSKSKKGTIRALHYQAPPKAQGKLVRVIKGKVWDVAVDIRKKSNTYKQWEAYELSEDNNRMIYIPPGFAHGFIALTDDVHLVYKCTEEYSKKDERGIRWDDPVLKISWPNIEKIVSDKDLALPFLKDANLFE